MMPTEPQKEHKWLQQLVGNWTSEMQAVMAPGEPPVTCTGTETVRSLGGLWTIGDGTGQMPDGNTGYTQLTLGFDPQKDRFVGTFVGSMMTHQWVYEGSLDAEGKRLVLDAEGPSFAGDGTTAKYQDIIEFVNADHRTLSSQVLGPDGKWNHFMTAHYRRAA